MRSPRGLQGVAEVRHGGIRDLQVAFDPEPGPNQTKTGLSFTYAPEINHFYYSNIYIYLQSICNRILIYINTASIGQECLFRACQVDLREIHGAAPRLLPREVPQHAAEAPEAHVREASALELQLRMAREGRHLPQAQARHDTQGEVVPLLKSSKERACCL